MLVINGQPNAYLMGNSVKVKFLMFSICILWHDRFWVAWYKWVSGVICRDTIAATGSSAGKYTSETCSDFSAKYMKALKQLTHWIKCWADFNQLDTGARSNLHSADTRIGRTRPSSYPVVSISRAWIAIDRQSYWVFASKSCVVILTARSALLVIFRVQVCLAHLNRESGHFSSYRVVN